MPQRLATRLTAVGERHLKAGHPWIYDQSIERVKGTGAAGDLAIIFDRRKDRFLGLGLYDPHSPIRIKVLHQGKSVKVDQDFFRGRIRTAAELREPLLATDTNSYRLINGENDGFPALIADVYAEVLVVKIYSLVWGPYFADILPLLLAETSCTTAVLRLSRNVQQLTDLPEKWRDGYVCYGTLSNPEVIFREHGVQFVANVISGHKTGFFLDHRANRKRVGELAAGRRVLDVFSYAGGFSVHALVGGAQQVISLDISEQALAVAKQNAALNLSDPPHQIIAADAFEAMEALASQGEVFGLVIVDPPSFAKRESEVEGALKAYRKLTRLAIRLVEKGGILLLASCSARVASEDFFDLQREELAQSGRKYHELERTRHDIDHPISFPEGAYLKSVYYQL
ncbi:MAG: class I SAM-dependent rRNA methyltransferase [Bacteroidota bacterium]